MCLNLLYEVENQLTFYKVRWFRYTFFCSVHSLFYEFWGSANILLQLSLKMGENEEGFESRRFFEAQKYYFVFESKLNFFSNGHICNVVSTSPNVVKIDVENDNVVLALFNIFQFTVEIHNVVWTLLNVVNFNVDVRNVVSMLTWRCWNVCLV